MPDDSRDRARRRNFSSLLILASLFRVVSYFVVGIAAALTLVLLVLAFLSGSPDSLLRFVYGSAGAVLTGLLLFLGSELIRLFVGIGRDIARMSGRWDERTPGGPPAGS